MVISIIIPTYNEALIIENTILHLQKIIPPSKCEIIISDGGSTDDTVQIAQKLGACSSCFACKRTRWANEFWRAKGIRRRVFFLACR